ncbi:hypothetical protein RRG08_066645 [Elysia crispata]|uniref:Uncharacterized protein n=1 Tax=Elysia crispata TaxID=231223 RepID=A0AAE1DI83_9GAST|nr:hypothetical protein RRG08_066645 [Elysia crispata]
MWPVTWPGGRVDIGRGASHTEASGRSKEKRRAREVAELYYILLYFISINEAMVKCFNKCHRVGFDNRLFLFSFCGHERKLVQNHRLRAAKGSSYRDFNLMDLFSRMG